MTMATDPEDVLHVVFERVDGVVGKDESVFDQIVVLYVHHVVNLFLLERIECHE